MRKFLIHSGLFILLLLTSFIFVFTKADGRSDAFYLRFTSPKQASLIIGTSRAAQGLQPEVINNILGRNDIYNYAFTMAHSPYGSVYNESIKKKLGDGKNGVFILAVDPWSFASLKENKNAEYKFRESKLALAKTDNVNLKFNIEYLVESYESQYYNLMWNNNSSTFLHDDGWLEVTVKMSEKAVINRTKNKLKTYSKYLNTYQISSIRVLRFKELVQYLEKKGNVYIVRLPVSGKMMDLENKFCPEFNAVVNEINMELKLEYLDMTDRNNEFNYTDGNQLSKASGAQVSNIVGQWIKNLEDEQVYLLLVMFNQLFIQYF